MPFAQPRRLRLWTACVLLLFLQFALPRAGAEPRVYRDHIEPHWFADHGQFWYRNALAGGASEFVLVNAETGKRAPAFDQARVAALLSKKLGREITGDHLPINALNFENDKGAVLLIGPGKSWRVDLQTYALEAKAGGASADGGLPARRTVYPSRASDVDTSIIFENHTAGVVQCWWIDPQGQRVEYAKIKPGGHWEQSTYVGHVWQVTDANGKNLGVFEAVADAGTAIIDGKPLADGPRNSPRSRRNDRRLHQNDHRSSHAGPVSPDGKWTVFVKDENLFLRGKDGGEFQMSRDGKSGDGYGEDRVWWSPDSSNFLALRVEAGEEHKIYTVESSPKDQVQPKLRTLDYLKPGDRIDHPRPALFHVAHRAMVALKDDLFATPWSIGDIRWSTDSSRVTFLYNQRGHQALRIITIDAKTGEAKPIVDEKSETFIDYSGKFFSRWIGDDELIWMSERDGWNHLWLYDAKNGRVKNQITRGDWVVREVVYVDEAARQIWFMAGGIRPGDDPYYTNFCRVNFDGSGLEILTEGNGNHTVDWTPGAKYFIDTWSRVDQAPINELRRSDTGALVCRLEEADASGVLAARGGHWPIPLRAKGRDGVTDIYGIVLLPRDFQEKKKYPVVEEIYAGPQDFYTPKSFRAGSGLAQRMADLGFIVVQCDGMGTSGRSKKFHDVCWKNLRDAGFPDRIPWIKAAAQKVPQMDLTRVGIFGGSAGGQNAMAALLWHNDFYKVAVADCGCHDNRMDKIWWNEQWMGWPVDKSYEESSNVVNAHLLEGKLMLVVGEMDDNVDPSSTMQVVNALEKANKDFELVVVTGAHHGAAETPYGSRKRAEFLLKNLLGKSE
ncbi:MAG TPA: DPP IV N-terminal domain-containing protein [Tepidisphaeraceae bacterium]|jgi:dipeptidyl aminopeptidase/acylaminoacyl peptidase|nr:DPP IV N-terminal domain-containing protein [Tepidisphaeraceae bacterium]